MVDISRSRLLAGLGVGVLAVSFASILIRLAQAEGMPSLSIAAWRLIVASAVLLPYTWATRRAEVVALGRRDAGLLALAGLFLGLHFAAWIASLGYTSVASSAVLVSMGPIFVALGAWLFWKERPGPLLALGVLLAAVGSIVVSWADLGQGGDHLLGDLLAVIGGVMVAGYLLIGRRVRGRLSLVAYAALVYGMGMLTLLGAVLLTGESLLGFSPEAYGWVLALALGPQLVGHSSLNWSLRYLSATFVSIVILAEPIASSILAYLILDERVTWATVAGGGLVLAGIYIASRAELAEPGRGP